MDIVTYKNKQYKQVEFNLFVNNYGCGAVHFVENKQFPWAHKKQLKFISWHVRKSDGKRYILVDHKSYDLDKLILRAYGDCNGDYYLDGAWDILYKDGDLSHCWQSNLQYVKRPHFTDKKTGMKAIVVDLSVGSVVVHENGDVFVNDKKLFIPETLVDADTNLYWAVNPSFTIEHRTYYMDDIMWAARFVNGDETMYANPVVLHLDKDYKNFTSCNLEFCDASDPRYLEYINQKREDMDDIEEAHNPDGRLFRTLKPRRP